MAHQATEPSRSNRSGLTSGHKSLQPGEEENKLAVEMEGWEMTVEDETILQQTWTFSRQNPGKDFSDGEPLPGERL